MSSSSPSSSPSSSSGSAPSGSVSMWSKPMSAPSGVAVSRPAAARSPVPFESLSLSRSASPRSGPAVPPAVLISGSSLRPLPSPTSASSSAASSARPMPPCTSLPLSDVSLGPSAPVPWPLPTLRSLPNGMLSGSSVLSDMVVLLEKVGTMAFNSLPASPSVRCRPERSKLTRPGCQLMKGGKVRPPLLRESSQGFTCFGAAEHLCQRLALARNGRRYAIVLCVAQQTLGGLDRDRRHGRQLFRPRPRQRQFFPRRHQLGHHARPQRLVCIKHPAEQQQLARQPRAGNAGQKEARRQFGNGGKAAGERETKLRVGGGGHQIAMQQQSRAAADGLAMHRRQQGLGKCCQTLGEPSQRRAGESLVQRAAAHPGQIGAGTKHFAAAGKDRKSV